MSITGRERRARRRITVVVIDREPAPTPPAIAAQERKASEPALEEVKRDVDSKAAASHAHAQSDVTGLVAALADKAPLASPALTGTPTVPTAAPGTNTTQAASTAFVAAALSGGAVTNSVEVDVDFGASETEDASLVVTGQAWVTANSKIVASLFGGTADHPEGDEDALVEGVTLSVVSRVVGVGFTVLAHAPERTTGAYRVHILGVG